MGLEFLREHGGRRVRSYPDQPELDLPEHIGDPAGTDAMIVAVVLDTLHGCDGGVHSRLAGVEGGDRGWQADARVGATKYDRDSHVTTLPYGAS